MNSLLVSQCSVYVQHEIHRFGNIQNSESVNSILKIHSKGNLQCPCRNTEVKLNFNIFFYSVGWMKVLYLLKYKTIQHVRQPPFTVSSSWRNGYNFVHDYKRNSPPSLPPPFVLSDINYDKFKSCVSYRPSFCFEYQMMDNLKKSTNYKDIERMLVT